MDSEESSAGPTSSLASFFATKSLPLEILRDSTVVSASEAAQWFSIGDVEASCSSSDGLSTRGGSIPENQVSLIVIPSACT